MIAILGDLDIDFRQVLYFFVLVFGFFASGYLILFYVLCCQAGCAPPRARNFLFGGAKKKVTK
ncbi:hypothetical protein, partial [Lacisediminimonas sp.]|uniref:hypothetical protein n=1 Tax=Lacisediminimonas sp. TaxID=3060582 RepID=UPI002718FF7B